MQFLRPQIPSDVAKEGGSNFVFNRNKHLPLRKQRELLPISRVKREILYVLEKYRTLVLVGETGCGKSTQLPLYLFEAGWAQGGRSVVCTQPRRIAAISIASRVAEEFGCKLGEEVGYGIRFDFRCGPRTAIKYYTDGVLLRETLTDPLLSRYSVIIIDEAHQRSLHSDILIGLLKKIQRKRPDLRIIVTSATLDAAAFKAFFETNTSSDGQQDTATILSIQGRQHPVDVLYLLEPCRNYLTTCAETILQLHQHEAEGDVLVFLPGMEEIDTVIAYLQDRYFGNTLCVLPLHSSLPHHVQQQVFLPPPNPSMRKVVLATNIAEASITIEGIRFVIDSGFVKLNYFDVRTGLEALVTVPITRTAAAQRAGRAGRTQAGKCLRLMTETSFASLAMHTPAEMQRVDITWAILQVKALGIHDVVHFDFLSPPSSDALVFALELLHSLGAVDEQCRITPLGSSLAEMPLEPRLAKCLLSSTTMGCSEEMLSIAAMATVEHPFLVPKPKMSSEVRNKIERDVERLSVVGSDHLTLLRIYTEFSQAGSSPAWCEENSLHYRILSRAKEIRANLLTLLKRFVEAGTPLASCGEDERTVRRCLVTGYFSNAARLANDGVYRTLRGQVAVQPHPQSVVALFGAPPEWVIYHEVVESRGTFMQGVTRIDPLWLHELAGHYYNLKL